MDKNGKIIPGPMMRTRHTSLNQEGDKDAIWKTVEGKKGKVSGEKSLNIALMQ
jgi:hypothetical protein